MMKILVLLGLGILASCTGVADRQISANTSLPIAATAAGGVDTSPAYCGSTPPRSTEKRTGWVDFALVGPNTDQETTLISNDGGGA